MSEVNVLKIAPIKLGTKNCISPDFDKIYTTGIKFQGASIKHSLYHLSSNRKPQQGKIWLKLWWRRGYHAGFPVYFLNM